MKTKKTNCENIFIDLISKKTLTKGFFKGIRHSHDVKKFKRTIEKGSPSFFLLWNFADFIKYAEKIFFIENSDPEATGCYSSRNFKAGQNGFRINIYNLSIVVKLFNSTCSIAMDIFYKDTNTTEQFKFKNEEWDQEHNLYDEMLLEQVIKIINREMIYLFEECYDKR